VELRTELTSCVLRPWTPADKPDLVRFADNRKVWRNLLDSFPHPYTAADADFWIAHANAPGASHFAIVVGGQAVGGIGAIAQGGLARKTAQFGYWLAEHAWGKGIATAAARAMAPFAFTALAVERLEAAVFAWNPASMRVLEKSGFTREGLHRSSVYKDGQLIDSVMYARLRVAAAPAPPEHAMFDHVVFGVSDYAASKAFFLKALEPLGVTIVQEGPLGLEISADGKSSLCIGPTDEKPAHLHLAFVARNRRQVEDFHRAALAAGGKDNGAPGLRPRYHANYYAAFVIGPDGHNIEVVCHKPEG